MPLEETALGDSLHSLNRTLTFGSIARVIANSVAQSLWLWHGTTGTTISSTKTRALNAENEERPSEAATPAWTMLDPRRKTSEAYHQRTFSRLPLELLIDIFDRVISESWAPLPNQLWCLAQVCRTWAQIIKQTSTFWNIIDSEVMVQTRLKLSKNASLTIQLPAEPSESFLQAIRPHSKRWKTLSLIGPARLLEGLSSLLEDEESILEDLHLESSDIPISLPFIRTPRLRSLRLTSVLPPLDNLAIGCLLTLHLAGLHFEPAALVGMLRRLPKLESLSICRLGRRDALPLPCDTSPLHLRNLKCLKLEKNDGTVDLQLQRCLVAHALVSFEYDASSASPTPFALNDGWIVSHATAVLRNRRPSKLSLRLRHDSLLAKDATGLQLLALRHTPVQLLLPSLSSIDDLAFSLDLDLGGFDIQVLDDQPFLQRVTLLYLSCCTFGELLTFGFFLSEGHFPTLQEVHLLDDMPYTVETLSKARARLRGPAYYDIYDSTDMLR